MNAPLALLWAWAAFLLVCGGLMALPFLPAWREWRAPTDCGPLPIDNDDTGDIRHFAERFRAQIEPALSAEGGAGIERPGEDSRGFDWAAARGPVAATGPATLPARTGCARPVYAVGDLVAGEGACLTAVFCHGDLFLGPRARLTDWAHADGRICAAPFAVAMRRISAGRAIELGRGAAFCRVKAPVVRFGTCADGTAGATALAEDHRPVRPYPRAVRRTAKTFLVKGDCRLAAGQRYDGSLVVTGRLEIGEGAAVYGDVKARGGMVIGGAVRVAGAAVSETDIEIRSEAWIAGPVVCEGDVRIGERVRIGAPDAPTTVTATRVLAEDGAATHGTVWARSAGVVAA